MPTGCKYQENCPNYPIQNLCEDRKARRSCGMRILLNIIGVGGHGSVAKKNNQEEVYVEKRV